MSGVRVPFNDFKARSKRLKVEQVEAFADILDSGTYILGDNVRSFEGDWASRTGSQFCIGVGNGMDAIELSLRAAGIRPGDEVVTTAMTAAATVLAIIRSGAQPVLADVNSMTGLLDMESVERCLSSKTRAIILVHLYGQLRDIEKWVSFCHESSLTLIEDCAQAHGASLGGRVAGSFGLAAGFSFYPTKNLGAIGDGGAVTTSDPELATLIRQSRNYGQARRYEHVQYGMNSRLDEVQASLLRVSLRYLEADTKRRIDLGTDYMKSIESPHVQLLAEPQGPESHVYHQFVVKAGRREQLRDYLEANNIGSDIHYPVSLDRQPVFKGVRCDPDGLPGAWELASTCISLPCNPEVTATQARWVVETINSWDGN